MYNIVPHFLRNKVWSLWKRYKLDPFSEDILLADERVYYTKKNALKRAIELAKELSPKAGWVIMIRKVNTDTRMCDEYIIDPGE